MTDDASVPIPPALDAEEWTEVEPLTESGYSDDLYQLVSRGIKVSDLTKIIALANHYLPDDDPRKITWAMVDIIREAGKWIGREGNPYIGFAKNLPRYADVLASYLPPRRDMEGQ
jgi:hypothetical protein